MATKTSAQSGSWSAGATWVGGVAPVDNDAVTIAAGHEVLMDADLSAFTGLQTVTVTGSDAGTPGMLYWKAGTSGILKIRTGYFLQGTNGTAGTTTAGRVLANSTGVWGAVSPLPFTDKALILFQGTAYCKSHNLSIDLQCTEPTNKYLEIYGTAYAVNQAVGVDVANNWIDLGVDPPAADTYVRVRSTGTLPGGLMAQVCYFIKEVSGTKVRLAPGANSNGAYTPFGAIAITSTGTGTMTLYTGVSSGTATVNVLQDVTGDTGWTTTSDHNRVALVNLIVPEVYSYDQQRLTLSTINATTVVLSAVLDSSQGPLSRIYMCSRNVSIRSAVTTTTGTIFNFGGYNSGQYIASIWRFNCEITNTAGSGTTFYGIAFYDDDAIPEMYPNDVPLLFGGISHGLYATFFSDKGRTGVVFTGYCVASHSCALASNEWDTSGDVGLLGHVAGVRRAIAAEGLGDNNEARIIGRIGGEYYGCSVVLYGVVAGVFAGTTQASVYVVFDAWMLTLGGTHYQCQYLSQQAQMNFVGSLYSCNCLGLFSDIKFTPVAHQYINILSEGGMLGEYRNLDPTDFSDAMMPHDWGYTTFDYGFEYPQAMRIHDFQGESGAFAIWCGGGRIVTETPGHHVMYAECNRDVVFFEAPISAKAGKAIRINVTAQLNGLSRWTALPCFAIKDPWIPKDVVGEYLDSETMVSNENLQEFVLTYTPTVDRDLVFSVRAVGGRVNSLGGDLDSESCAFTYDINPTVIPIAALTIG